MLMRSSYNEGMDRKILVAVDGSVFSYNALRYLSYLFTDLEGIYVHLLNIVPSSSLPAGKEWMDELELMCSMSPQTRNNMKKANRFMEEAVLQLGRRGIAPEQVSTSVRLARRTVADDIITEARKGLYDALLIGRRGITNLEKIFIGSVSSSVASKCYEIPIWIVDGKVNSRKFLMPVDGTFNSLKAADHLGFILAGNPYAEIALFHIATWFGDESKKIDREELLSRWGREWLEEHLSHEEGLFTAPEEILIGHGIAPERIERLSIKSGISPTKHILHHSEINDYGTIVIGRREKWIPKGVLKGVSDKILNLASGVAVWVVG